MHIPVFRNGNQFGGLFPQQWIDVGDITSPAEEQDADGQRLRRIGEPEAVPPPAGMGRATTPGSVDRGP